MYPDTTTGKEKPPPKRGPFLSGSSYATVTAQVSVVAPGEVAVMVAVPDATEVTTPAEETVATATSLELHVTPLL